MNNTGSKGFWVNKKPIFLTKIIEMGIPLSLRILSSSGILW